MLFVFVQKHTSSFFLSMMDGKIMFINRQKKVSYWALFLTDVDGQELAVSMAINGLLVK